MSRKERRESTNSDGSSDSDSSSNAEEETKPSNDIVLNKYTSAGEIANTVLKELIAKVKEGVSVGELCDHGDNRVIELTGNLFKKDAKIQKGIAMPTCISVDNVVCHFSPLKSDPPVILKNDQVVKIDVGAHLDGFVGLAAHTVVVGADKDNKVKGKKANAILAAYNCLEAALRYLHPSRGKDSLQITDAISKITKSYGVNAVENMVSHELGKYKVTGEKQIIQNPADDQKSKVEKFTFENYDVFAIDVLVSTGDGKVKSSEYRTTVFKKADDLVYSLKMKASRQFLSEVTKKFQNLPFSLRMFGSNENAAKLGSVECVNHALITPYSVLIDKESEVVAHFKATVIILPNGILKIAGLPLEENMYETDLKIEDEQLAALIKESLKPKKKKVAKKGDAVSEEKPAETEIKVPEKEKKPIKSPKKA